MAAGVQIPASPPKPPETLRFRGLLVFGKVQESITEYISTNTATNTISSRSPRPHFHACKEIVAEMKTEFSK